ncbi:hypothetical protein [Spirosoma arboris]|nr:hypothetical protein [Spirosoma arboris]
MKSKLVGSGPEINGSWDELSKTTHELRHGVFQASTYQVATCG